MASIDIRYEIKAALNEDYGDVKVFAQSIYDSFDSNPALTGKKYDEQPLGRRIVIEATLEDADKEEV